MELVDLLVSVSAFLPAFVVDHWEAIGVILVALTVIAGAVARMTKTETDDKVVGVVSRVINFVTKLPLGRKKV